MVSGVLAVTRIANTDIFYHRAGDFGTVSIRTGGRFSATFISSLMRDGMARRTKGAPDCKNIPKSAVWGVSFDFPANASRLSFGDFPRITASRASEIRILASLRSSPQGRATTPRNAYRRRRRAG